MSLDVYLNSKPKKVRLTCSECGRPHTVEKSENLFQQNITHNLGEMAQHAGLYEYLWRPGDVNIHRAADLIEPLQNGLYELESFPETYMKYNPSNGWGTYYNLVDFVKKYLSACCEFPGALVEVNR